MDPVNPMKSTTEKDQPVQSSNAEAQTEITAQNMGVLNGLNVEVLPIKEGQINGITVDNISKQIPLKTRIVKLAKDFAKKVKSLRQSKVKKYLDKKAGQTKRAVKHQNWSTISTEREKELLLKVKFDDAREVLKSRIDSFNEKLKRLQQLKENIGSLENHNIKFETTYATAMEAANNSMKGKTLPKGLVVEMPPAKKGQQDPQYIQIIANDSASRREAVQALGTLFRNCQAYKDVMTNKHNIVKFKKERNKLKKEIKGLERELKALYKGYKNDWIKQKKEAVRTQAESTKVSKASNLLEQHKKKMAGVESQIVLATTNRDKLKEKAVSLKTNIEELQKTIKESKARLKKLDDSVSIFEVEKDSVIDEKSAVFNEKEFDAIKDQANVLRNQLEQWQTILREYRSNRKQVNNHIVKAEKQIQQFEKEKQKLEEQYRKDNKALEKEVADEIRKGVKSAHEDGDARFREFSAHVDGSGEKRKHYESPAPVKAGGSREYMKAKASSEEVTPLLDNDDQATPVEPTEVDSKQVLQDFTMIPIDQVPTVKHAESLIDLRSDEEREQQRK